MSDSSKRRGTFRGSFGSAAPCISRGQKAVRSAIESLESRVLMSTSTFTVTGNGDVLTTVPTLTAGETASFASLRTAIAAADSDTLDSAVIIKFGIGATAIATSGLTLSTNVGNTTVGGLTVSVIGAAGKPSITGGANTPITVASSIASATFTGLSFINSRPTTGNGGAINTAAPLVLNGDTFTSDTATGGSGGAVYSSASGNAVYTPSVTTASGATATVVVVGSHFLTDSAQTGGGLAITNPAATTVVLGSTFTSDTVTSTTGAANGGAIYSTGASLKLGGAVSGATANDTFIGDKATFGVGGSGGNGGAVYSTDATVSVTFDAFTSDTAAGNGGAIADTSGAADSSFTATGTAFASDRAGTSGYGGGVYASVTTATLSKSPFTSDSAAFGGGIALGLVAGSSNPTTALIQATTFSADTATSSGGGLYATSTATASLTINGAGTVLSDFAHDTAGTVGTPGTGGAIYASGPSLSTSIVGTEFLTDSANDEGWGGAIYSAGSSLALNAAASASNASANVSFSSDTATGTSSAGGAIYSLDSDITAAWTSIITSSAQSYGGAVYYGGTNAGSGSLFRSCTFTNDKTTSATPINGESSGMGGAICNFSGVGTFTLTSDTFGTCTAAADGGAVYSGGGASSTLTLNSTGIAPVGDKFTACVATTGSGGAVESHDNTLNVQGAQFLSDKAIAGFGGGLMTDASSLTIGSGTGATAATLGLNVLFSTDTAYSGGGGLYFGAVNGNAPAGTGTIYTFTTFLTDKATNGATPKTQAWGGAIWDNSAGLTIGSGVSTGAVAFTTDSADTLGGAIYSADPSLTISHGAFGAAAATADSAAYGGGAIYYIGGGALSVSLSNFKFDKVTAATEQGGAINVNSATSVVLSDDSFISCTTPNGGGGLYANSGTVTVYQCLFSACTSVLAAASTNGSGGGIFADSGVATLNVFDSTFAANTTVQQGGGIFTAAGTDQIADDTFDANKATGAGTAGGGGGLCIYQGTATVAECTFDANVVSATSLGGGIQNVGGTVTLEGNLIAKNIGPTAEADIAGTFVSTSSFNVFGLGTSLSGTGLTTGTPNFNVVATTATGLTSISLSALSAGATGSPATVQALLTGTLPVAYLSNNGANFTAIADPANGIINILSTNEKNVSRSTTSNAGAV